MSHDPANPYQFDGIETDAHLLNQPRRVGANPFALMGYKIFKAHIRANALEVGVHHLGKLTLIKNRAALFAQHYRRNPEEVASVVVITTVASLVLVPIMLTYLLLP